MPNSTLKDALNTPDIAGIAGIGVDIVDVARIRKLLEKYPESFAKRNFSKEEIEYCDSKADSAIHYAARFAAKEAMVKALGTGFADKITLLSVSIVNDPLGAPVAVLDSYAQERLGQIGAKKMFISISHLKDCAVAYAVAAK